MPEKSVAKFGKKASALALSLTVSASASALLSSAVLAQGRPAPDLSHHSADFDPFHEHAPVVSGAHSSAPPSGPITNRPLLPGMTGVVPSSVAPTSAAATSAAPTSVAATSTAPSVTAPEAAVKASVSRYQSRSRTPRTHGEAVLPMMVHMAMRPELMDIAYLKMVLGTADNKGVSSFGMASLHWTPKERGGPVYALQNGVASFSQKHNLALLSSAPSATIVQKTFLAQFPHSGIQFKHLKKQLGEPLRSYYDDNGHPVQEFQFVPNATLTVTEPHNCFDISRMTVTYNGPQLAPPSAQDYAVASQFRLGAARKYLASGNTVRCAELLNEHIKENPEDAGAHLILARTYRHYGDINGSMAEYRRALDLARRYGNVTVEKDAYEGLSQFGVVATTRKTASKSSHTH